MRIAFPWIHAAARILNNEEKLDAQEVERRLQALLDVMKRDREQAGALAPAVDRFLKVSRSYWPGLFHCYSVKGLPRTNNDLEQFFGSSRHHERRTTGRKGAVPGLVVRGAVRIVAAVATRARPFTAEDLRLTNLAAWRDLRTQLTARQAARCAQFRFRQDPEAYLAALEARFSQSGLPS